MTGTRHLNDPDMLIYENEVATYLKSSPNNYVRYRVTPIFRNNELLTRGGSKWKGNLSIPMMFIFMFIFLMFKME